MSSEDQVLGGVLSCEGYTTYTWTVLREHVKRTEPDSGLGFRGMIALQVRGVVGSSSS